jgi:hypothetical protein
MGLEKKITTAAIAAVACMEAISQVTDPILALPFGKKLDREILECRGALAPPDYCSLLKPVNPSISIGTFVLKRPVAGALIPLPSWMEDIVTIEIDDNGILDSIHATTIGPSGQERVIEAVAARFGPPTRRETREARNASGGTWNVILATWSTPDLTIRHDCLKITECYLFIDTPAAIARQKDRIDKRKMADKL